MSYDTLEKVPGEDVMGHGPKLFRKELVQAAASEWVELDSNHWLAVVVEDASVNYGLYSFAMSDVDGDNTYLQCVFRGRGYADSLREMRHTYFNPDEEGAKGYVFYLPIEATIKALAHLKKYFNDY